PIEQLEAVTENALTIAETFEKDVSEVTRSANQLMKDFGLTADQAFDYITKGFQKGLDYSGEFLDVINEYSPQFKALGFSGQEFFNTLAAGAQSGAFNLDKVGDAVKEFNIRAKDGSDLTNQAFEDLNLNAEEMSLNFAKGGDQAQKSFKKVVQELSKVQDPLKKNEIG
ncbi:phage tail tape measure protein, partial [Streptomyces gulbargensis]